MTRVRAEIVFALGCAFSAILGWGIAAQPSVVALDYHAFYCAGVAVREHRNPYHTQSLRGCELYSTDAQYRARLPGTTLPAPQPMYDLSLFALFAGMPFGMSKAVWGALLGIAVFITAFCLERLTRMPPPVILAVLATSLICNTLALGQIVPVYSAAACGAALLLRQGRTGWAGAAAAVTLIEPHLGLPICVSLAVWCPRSRAPLGLACAALAAIALVVGGVASNVEYVTKVLPLHALSELGSDGQLSLSVILHAVHLPQETALKLGSVSYVFMTAVGVCLARPASLRLQNAALLAAVPAAAAVIGGTFLHGTEIVAALPLALLLVDVKAIKPLAVGILVLLATPWAAQSQPHQMVPWFALSALCTAYVLTKAGGVPWGWSAIWAVVIFVTLCQVNFGYEQQQIAYISHEHAAEVRIDELYPQAGWARVDEGTYWTQNAFSWIMRAPTWLGLICLLYATALLPVHSRTARLIVNVN